MTVPYVDEAGADDDGVVTLAERHRRKLDGMRAALRTLDSALADYARQHGGRFIRFGSSASGALRPSSDVDIIADFERDEGKACRTAEYLCIDLGLMPDCRPAKWLTPTFVERAASNGILLP